MSPILRLPALQRSVALAGADHSGRAASAQPTAHPSREIGGGQFWRVRIGVGKPPVKGPDHVLSRPSVDDDKPIRECIDAAYDAVVVMLEQGSAKAMNQLHARNPKGSAPSA